MGSSQAGGNITSNVQVGSLITRCGRNEHCAATCSALASSAGRVASGKTAVNASGGRLDWPPSRICCAIANAIEDESSPPLNSNPARRLDRNLQSTACWVSRSNSATKSSKSSRSSFRSQSGDQYRLTRTPNRSASMRCPAGTRLIPPKKVSVALARLPAKKAPSVPSSTVLGSPEASRMSSIREAMKHDVRVNA